MAKSKPSEPSAMRLPEVLDLKAAAPLRDQLLAARGQPIRLDASRVQRIGGLCLQVLMSARLTWDEDKLPLQIVDPSPEFTDGLALFGAASLMDQTGATL
jgi:chemotaxis protein CheX